jgi:hypothetical protein
VLQRQLRLKLRRTKRSLSKVSLLRKTHLKQTQKPLLQPLLQPLSDIDDNDDLIIDDEVTFGRNRRANQFGQIVHEKEAPLSDYVQIRLALARMKAIKKYREIYNVV